MSSRKRRAARCIRLAMRAYEQFWRHPECDALRTAFQVRHRAALGLYGANAMKWAYRLHMARLGADPTVIIERGGVIFQRIA